MSMHRRARSFPRRSGTTNSSSPTVNLPVLMLAPVFASMIEPSVVSPGGPRTPLERIGQRRCVGKPAGEATCCVAHPVCTARWTPRRRRVQAQRASARAVDRRQSGLVRAAGRGSRACRAPPARRRSAARWSRPVSAARSGWATPPSLTPLRSAKARTACSVVSAVQGSTASSSPASSPSRRPRLRGQQGGGLVVERERPVGAE